MPLDPARITEVLAHQGLFVSELTTVRPDLEEVFLRLTRTPVAHRPRRRVDHRREVPLMTGRASVVRLIGVELRRLLARRITWLAAVLLLSLLGLMALLATWVLSMEYSYLGAGGESSVPALVDFGESGLLLAAFGAMLAAYLVAASFVAAEWTSGALATWLTFVPDRLRVFGTKLAAVLVASGAIGVLTLGLAFAVLVAIVRGYGGSLEGAADLLATGGRSLLMVMVAGIFGFCVALATRRTGPAVGLVLGYLVLAYVLNIVVVTSPALSTLPLWLPEHNVLAVVLDGTTSYSYDDEGGNQVERTVTLSHAAAYWVTLTGAVLVGSALLFRRRDVT